jgi:hypothetical protein
MYHECTNKGNTMLELMKLSKNDNPDHIHTKVRACCELREHDTIEDCGYIMGLTLRDDAHQYNPGKPGTLEAEAYHIGVSLALLPWIYEDPQDVAHRSPPQHLHCVQVPSKADAVSIHSPLVATVLAACVGVLGWVLLTAPF